MTFLTEMYFKTVLLFLLSLKLEYYSALLDAPEHLTTTTVPEDRNFEKKIGYSEDAVLNFTELLSKYGYPSTEYSVVTEDGYILGLFQMRSKGPCKKLNKTPVLLMHGVLDSSFCWVSGPDAGLAYGLADACYDVWLGNTRGNIHSRKHLRLNPDKDAKFWDFTFHEHGTLDLPAIVDFILEKTGAKQVAYVGHSQGTTEVFVLGSTRPEYNKKLKIAACLGPGAWLYHMFSPLLQAIAKIRHEFVPIFKTLGLQELFGSTSSTDFILKLVCQSVAEKFCGDVLHFIFGLNKTHTPPEILRSTLGHFPTGTSLDNINHFGQLLNEDRFGRLDYGEQKNLIKYGTAEALDYNVSLVSAPVALYCGKNDYLISLKDVETLRKALPNVVEYVVLPPDDWSHLDFIWPVRGRETLMPLLIDLFNKFDV